MDSKCISSSHFSGTGASPRLAHPGQDKKEKRHQSGILGESKRKGWTPVQGPRVCFMEIMSVTLPPPPAPCKSASGA